MTWWRVAGVLRIMELPRNLRRPVHNEKKLLGTWLERQQARLADVGARQPVRTSARKEAEVRPGPRLRLRLGPCGTLSTQQALHVATPRVGLGILVVKASTAYTLVPS